MSGLPRPWKTEDIWAEPIDDLLNGGPDFLEVEEAEWPLPLAERYIQQQAWLHLHFRIAMRGSDIRHSAYLCGIIAAIERPLEGEGRITRGGLEGDEAVDHGVEHSNHVNHLATRVQSLIGIPTSVEEGAAVIRSASGDHGGVGERAMDIPVLVYVIQISKHGKRMPPREVRSRLVRLQTLNECEIWTRYAGGQSLDLRYAKPRLPERLGFIFIDRKLCLPGRIAMASENELPQEVVQGRTQVVGELPHRKPKDQRRRLTWDPKDIGAGLRVEVTDYAVTFTFENDGPLAVKEGQALICTVEPEVDASQGTNHSATL
jgi:hypothetical protein